jgi:hypothetical protein
MLKKELFQTLVSTLWVSDMQMDGAASLLPDRAEFFPNYLPNFRCFVHRVPHRTLAHVHTK